MQERLRVALAAAETGLPVVDGRLTTGAYVDTWLESVRMRVRPATAASYEATVKLYLGPELGGIALVKLAPGHVTGMLTRLSARAVVVRELPRAEGQPARWERSWRGPDGELRSCRKSTEAEARTMAQRSIREDGGGSPVLSSPSVRYVYTVLRIALGRAVSRAKWCGTSPHWSTRRPRHGRA